MTNNPADFNAVFSELSAAGLEPVILRQPKDAPVFHGVVTDSRKASPNVVFCAVRGANHDGHEWLKGSSPPITLALVETTPDGGFQGSFGVIKVKSTRAAWAQLASFFAGHPTRRLRMIGVTGTNGKTSTVWMAKSILSALGVSAATIGTLGYCVGQTIEPSPHTTPDPDALYPFLASLPARGISCVIMEVSSHSLAQGKVWPIIFQAAAFTSFSQDHLDFHADMEDYLATKMRLFESHLDADGFGLFHRSLLQLKLVSEFVNKSHDQRQRLATYSSEERVPDYSVRSKSDYTRGFSCLNVLNNHSQDRANVDIPMVGDVFSENFTAAMILCAQITGKSIQMIETSLIKAEIQPVPGRLELVTAPKKPWRPLVYVDYAHTPDALEKAIINLSPTPRSLVTVFGCGGDRDKSKRPIMGDIADRLSRDVIVTSDNPRTEPPEAIVNDVIAGTSKRAGIHKIIDRREAIKFAVSRGGPENRILIAGKGHETYQIHGTTKTHFSDQEEALAELAARKSWLVVGGGVSGFAAAQLLLDADEDVFINDDRPLTLPKGLSSASQVAPGDIPWDKISNVVVSPGVSPDHPVFLRARSLNKDILTEIDLGFDGYRGSILAVTGTNGKSTTVAMAEFLCKNAGKNAVACGNIGLPPSALNLRSEPSSHVSVVELSSYQLEGCRPWEAKAAAITSFSYDHIARHKTMDAYFEAKWRITRWLRPGSLFIVTCDVARYAERVHAIWPDCEKMIVGASFDDINPPAGTKLITVDQGLCEIAGQKLNLNDYRIFGSHNHINALVASLLSSAVCGVSVAELAPKLARYKTLPFRCEIVFENERRVIINDSKSTNLESTLSALSIAKRPAILLMGGQGKGESYRGLESCQRQVRVLLTFGASSELIASEAPANIPCERFQKMRPAVLRALDLARDNNWDIIFSPGCASFDEFNNFEHRGAEFNKLVEQFAIIKS